MSRNGAKREPLGSPLCEIRQERGKGKVTKQQGTKKRGSVKMPAILLRLLRSHLP